MQNESFEHFLSTTRTKAAEAYVKGNPLPVLELVKKSAEASFHAPTGDTVEGAEAVAARYANDSRVHMSGGETRFEVIQQYASGDLAFWTGFQIAKATREGASEPTHFRIRVTEVFRKLDGHWQLIHRHADVTKPE